LFCAIASTGRTATSFLAECLNRIPGVAACHEGHLGNDDGPDVLPLVNLENLQAYKSPVAAADVVAKKRSPAILDAVVRDLGVQVLFDVAYYNSMLLDQILDQNPTSRGVAIVRDCESFVRSATWLTGEDPMPVGWPDPSKPLSARERFISMGRIRPTDDTDAVAASEWKEWSAVRRNIWLWRSTNEILLETCRTWAHRVEILDFRELASSPREAVAAMLAAVGVDVGTLPPGTVDEAITAAFARQNERTGGYQLADSAEWSNDDRQFMRRAQQLIDELMEGLRV
jgi:hypothetical protein